MSKAMCMGFIDFDLEKYCVCFCLKNMLILFSLLPLFIHAARFVHPSGEDVMIGAQDSLTGDKVRAEMTLFVGTSRTKIVEDINEPKEIEDAVKRLTNCQFVQDISVIKHDGNIIYITQQRNCPVYC